MEVPAHKAQLNRTFANFQMLVEFESIMLIVHRDWSPKFETGLNIIIGIVQKV